MTQDNPYASAPDHRFWKRAVGSRHFADLESLWVPPPLKKSDRVATAGSCFAQHIGRRLTQRGANFLDLEPAPAPFASEAEERRFGYGVFSCRYGNIYTSSQLIQLMDEAYGRREPVDGVWEKGGRFYDALRPGVDPVGQASADVVRDLRQGHLKAVRSMFETVDFFVFTMGLTEAWRHRADGTAYPLAPGTVAGTFDPQAHEFVNLTYREVHADMVAFLDRLREVNPGARVLLTVSPVPLVATASADHVLVATVYSKSVLRAVAGDLAAEFDHVHYFPSYEIVSAHPTRGAFFNPDLRTVNEMGVDLVMKNFFSGPLATEFPPPGTRDEDDEAEIVCDEEALERVAAR